MVYYKLVKIIINTPMLAEVIIDVVVNYHSLPDLIIINKGLFFTSKFWLLLCYFFNIQRWLSSTFYPRIDGQIKMQTSIIKAYLWALVNFEQNDKAKFLLMVNCAFDNANNASNDHTPFELH